MISFPEKVGEKLLAIQCIYGLHFEQMTVVCSEMSTLVHTRFIAHLNVL